MSDNESIARIKAVSRIIEQVIRKQHLGHVELYLRGMVENKIKLGVVFREWYEAILPEAEIQTFPPSPQLPTYKTKTHPAKEFEFEVYERVYHGGNADVIAREVLAAYRRQEGGG